MTMKKPSYDHLFLDILKIGQSCIATGLSYETLKMELIKKGYDFTCDCIELAVKQWFFDCFHHRDESDTMITKIEELEKHLECNFVMKGDSCLKLLDRKTANRNMWVAINAVIIAVLTLLYTIYHDRAAVEIEQQSSKSKQPYTNYQSTNCTPSPIQTSYNYHYYIDSPSVRK